MLKLKAPFELASGSEDPNSEFEKQLRGEVPTGYTNYLGVHITKALEIINDTKFLAWIYWKPDEITEDTRALFDRPYFPEDWHVKHINHQAPLRGRPVGKRGWMGMYDPEFLPARSRAKVGIQSDLLCVRFDSDIRKPNCKPLQVCNISATREIKVSDIMTTLAYESSPGVPIPPFELKEYIDWYGVPNLLNGDGQAPPAEFPKSKEIKFSEKLMEFDKEMQAKHGIGVMPPRRFSVAKPGGNRMFTGRQSSLAPRNDYFEVFIPGLLALLSSLVMLMGLKKFRSLEKPVRAEQEALIYA